MLARIGMVLYWVATGIAALLAVGTVAAMVMGAFGLVKYYKDWEDVFLESFVFIPALLIWLIGRACRYFLAGK
jgi:hypothetical protein